jgi:dGTPase
VAPRLPRERTEELERASLSGWGTLAAESKGREQPEPADPMRTAFAVDVDRITASTAFRRLRDKRHSLLAPRGDAPRQRLDHTLAGARIARSIARGLRLNEDLAEAISLGRDLGAPAFARAGEDALGLVADQPFRHSHQSLRVVESLEADGAGLNLTWEVRDGIACHALDAPTPATREGEAVRLADRVADLAGEVADALAAGLLTRADLPAAVRTALGEDPSQWGRAVVRDAVAVSADTPEVRLPAAIWAALDDVRTLLDDRVDTSHGVLAEHARASHCLSSLVLFYVDNPGRLPSAHRVGDEPPLARVVDHVASLTDGQALRLFASLFLPHRSGDGA